MKPVVVSKTPPLGDIPDDQIAAAINRAIQESRSKLRIDAIDGYLLHRASDWRRLSVRAALRGAQENGTIQSIGVSSYDADEVMDLLDIEGFDILQIPFSIFDRRAHTSGLLDRTNALGVAVCARSIFLQGLLFLDPMRPDPDFRDAAPHLSALRGIAAEAGCDLATIAIQGALDMEGIATVIVGLYAADQVDQAVASAAARLDTSVIEEAIRVAGAIPANIRDPRLWRQR